MHDAIPYVWSEQHGTKIQLVGRVNPQWEIAVVEGDAERGRRAVLYHDGIWVHAALTMNWPRALAVVRRGLATELEVAAVQAELQPKAYRRPPPRHGAEACPIDRILVSGHGEDLVVLDGDVALFEKRIVVLDNTPPRYLVYPV
ncbi:oxidoreductase C-terminal domain-containing protein [Pseudonocardia benzenivorans]